MLPNQQVAKVSGKTFSSGTHLRKFSLIFEDNKELAMFPEGYESVNNETPVVEIPAANAIVGIYGKIAGGYIH